MGLPTMFLGRSWRALRFCGSPVYARGCCGPNTPLTPITPNTPTTPTPSGDNAPAVGYEEGTATSPDHGVVVGVWEVESGLEMTPATKELDQKAGGKISKHLNTLSQKLKLGKAFVLTDVTSELPYVAVTSLGPKDACYNKLEELEEGMENTRVAIAAGCRAIHRAGAEVRALDVGTEARAAAEALLLTDWSLKVNPCGSGDPKTQPLEATAQLLPIAGAADAGRQFALGRAAARAQNWARYLSDMPANRMTPVDLAQAALDTLCPLGVKVQAHDRSWVVAQRMEAFLAVARGSCEQPIFLECSYSGAGDKTPPVLLSAKGITFDSGGLCLKRPESMVENRGSMAGAAVVLAALKAIALLKVPLNVAAVIPLCENMISGQCMKVGDVVRALNGLSIQIEHTDMEGRLLLADALVYGQAVYRPELIVNVATLTHGVELATGGGAFGCFCSSEEAWNEMRRAGSVAGDRPWRLPLWQYYQRQITNEPSVDLRNKGSGKASPCLGAAFLKNFICCDFVHLDITGVGKLAHAPSPPYLHPRRMTGRPTRTLVHFLQQLAANSVRGSPDASVASGVRRDASPGDGRDCGC